MNNLAVSKHALTRAAQRSITLDDLDLVMLVGSEVDDGYFIRDRDCDTVERQIRQLLKQLRRLRGVRVVIAGSQVVTTYRPDRCHEKRLLRKAEEREMSY